MTPRASWTWPAVLLAATLVPLATVAQPDSSGYRGIPDGFDFPADKATLEEARRAQNVSAQRLHSWMLFAGITQPTPDGTPAWETWYRESEAFRRPGPTPQGPRRIVRQFRTATQLTRGRVGPQAPGKSLMTFVLFNGDTFRHIRTNRLYLKSTLARINAGFGRAPWNQRKVPDFPARAMSLKTIWWPASGDSVTPLPIWDDDPANPEMSHTWDTWKRIVAVDPVRRQIPAGETTTISFLGAEHRGSAVVGLDRFYSVTVDASILAPITQAIAGGDTGLVTSIRGALGRDLKIGDRLLFLGCHMTSKEIDDWTWSTFWWHDQPDAGPFGADRPAQVAGVWRNYRMAVADDQLTPSQPDGSPRVAYNPWLEGNFSNGIVSNCMSCHHRATYPPAQTSRQLPPFLPVTRGAPDPSSDVAYRPRRLQTDFMWSVALQSR